MIIRANRHWTGPCIWGPSMTRKSARMLLALVAVWAQQASAQTAGSGAGGSGSTTGTTSTATDDNGNMNVTMVEAGGEPFKETDRLGGVPINVLDCLQGTIKVTVSGLPNSSQYPYLEVWYASGTGNCNQSDRATRVSVESRCTKLELSREDSRINNRQYYDVVVPIAPVCQLNSENRGSDGQKTLWFLALKSEGSAEEAVNYRSFNFKVDTDPPDPPVIEMAGSGESDIRLAWSLPAGDPKRFWVVADVSGGALVDEDLDGGVGIADGCSSSYLASGKNFDPSSRPEGLFVDTFEMATTEASYSADQLRNLMKVPVVVVAGDLAGNPSPMSDLACLSVVETNGFWDSYKTNGGADTAEPGCACSAPGAAGRSAGAWTAVPVALLLGGAYARRRTRRRAR